MCPHQTHAFKEVKNSQAFTVGIKIIYPCFFLNEPLPGAPTHVCTKLSANIQRIERWTSIKSCLTPKIESTPKTSNYDAKP